MTEQPIDLDAVLAVPVVPIKVVKREPWPDRWRRWWRAVKRWFGAALAAVLNSSPAIGLVLAVLAVWFWFGFTLFVLGVLG